MVTLDQFQSFCHQHQPHPHFGGKLFQSFGAELTNNKPPLIFLEVNACSGDSISTLNTVDPELGQVICSILDVRYWSAIMPEQGKMAQERLFETAAAGDFILMVEGAIATAGRGKYAVPFKDGGYLFTSEELVRYLAPKARYIIAVGTCASFGGPSAARPNPSNSKGVWEIIEQPVVNVSGCPINPDWLTGTLFHLLLFGLPELDRYQRPVLFYGQTIASKLSTSFLL